MTDVEIKRGLPQEVRLPWEKQGFGVTPFFKHYAPLNVALSEEQGREVYDPIIEVVELQLAGDRNYSPVVPAASMARKNGVREITFAELYADQYRSFILGDEQIAGGTALEVLTEFGITPAQLSVCRALKIYSVEALHELDGPRLKGLGMSANDLKKMANRYMDERRNRPVSDETDALRAEIERLKAIIEPQKEPDEIDAIVEAADGEFELMTDDELKAYIKKKSGTAPRGTPTRAFLLNAAQELAA